MIGGVDGPKPRQWELHPTFQIMKTNHWPFYTKNLRKKKINIVVVVVVVAYSKHTVKDSADSGAD